MLPVQLGQRVYGVTRNGNIVATLVNSLELPQEYDSKSKLAMVSARRMKGRSHPVDGLIKFGTLNHSLDKAWTNFDEAYVEALSRLAKLVADDSISVKAFEHATARHQALLEDKEAERTRVDNVHEFSASETMFSSRVSQEERPPIYRESDFPKHYIYPGTAVWIADTGKWRLIRGHVTAVACARRQPRELTYNCGSHTNLRSRQVHREKALALDFLSTAFQAAFPGTLDPGKVPVVEQISQEEHYEQVADQYRKLADRHKPKPFD